MPPPRTTTLSAFSCCSPLERILEFRTILATLPFVRCPLGCWFSSKYSTDCSFQIWQEITALEDLTKLMSSALCWPTLEAPFHDSTISQVRAGISGL
jgi:hypothetical protein